MRLVKIFVASSNELEDDRIHLGDSVRKANDIFELQNVRVKLYKWEDFSPYFIGKRSQDEYNECLKQCDAVIGLFETKLGKYTCEEIEVALKKLGYDAVYCFAKVPTGSSIPGHISEFFSKNSLGAQTYSDVSEFDAIVRKIVQESISRGIEDNYTPVKRATYIYATIPDDNADQRHKIGDAIRSLDDEREFYHKDRCKLYPLRTSNLIPQSNLYMAFLKDELGDVDENEIRTAKREHNNSTLTHLAIYYDDSGKFKESKLWREISSWNYYMPVFKNTADVLFELSKYLDRRRVTCKDDYEVESGQVTTNGVHIGPIKELSEFSKDKEIIRCSSRQDSLYDQFSKRLLELSDERQSKTDNKLVDFSYEINENDVILQKRLLLSLLESTTLIPIPRRALTLKLETIHKIRHLQESIYNDVKNKTINESKLEERINELHPLLQKAMDRGWISNEDYFAIQSAFLLLYEKYYDIYPIELYISTIAFADNHRIVNFRTEELRERIAADYCQKGDLQRSIVIHRTVLNNYKILDDGSLALRRRWGQSYLSFCSIFLNYEITQYLPDLLKIIKEWGTLVNSWYSQSQVYLPEVGNYMAVLLRVQNMYGCIDDQVFDLRHIHNIYQRLLANFSGLSLQAKENFIYFGNVFATIYIDHPGEYASMTDSFLRAEYYLNSSIDKAWQLYKINPVRSLAGLSLLYHNYGFELVKSDKLLDAVSYYESTIDIRRQFLRKNLLVQAKDDLGESLVNYGDLLRQLKDYPNAIPVAKEAIQLYEMSKSDAHQKLDYYDMNIYKSIQLLGSIYYEMGDNYKEEGLTLLSEVWGWAQLHPTNTYMPSFVGTSFRILKKEGLV